MAASQCEHSTVNAWVNNSGGLAVFSIRDASMTDALAALLQYAWGQMGPDETFYIECWVCNRVIQQS